MNKLLLNLRLTDKSCRGVTLIELMVTVALAAIVTGLAVPSFERTIRSNRLTGYANEWVASLNFARSEAVKRGVPVSIRRKSDTAGEWEEGWNIFVDWDGDGVLDGGKDETVCNEAAEDCLLKTYDSLSAGYTLRSSGDNDYKDYATYLAGGLAKHQVAATFRLCDNTQNTQASRTIVLNAVGRPTTAVNNAASCP
ncbi:MAG: GspH/FimT family pseudopilin [Methylomonas sp.]|nr:GspH/FimT family pseudopilin [Methylomonas sp.]